MHSEKTMKANRYFNPFAPKDTHSYIENNAKCVLEYRGFKVFYTPDHWGNDAYDFVIQSICVTQRDGITRAKEIIDLFFSKKLEKSLENPLTIRAGWDILSE